MLKPTTLLSQTTLHSDKDNVSEIYGGEDANASAMPLYKEFIR